METSQEFGKAERAERAERIERQETVMKTGREDSEAYFRTKPPCPAFGGVAPRNMKIKS